MAPGTRQDLQLNRKLLNKVFESWRLGSSFLVSKDSISLPGTVITNKNEALDYLHTRASVLRNHLLLSQGRVFIFVSGSSVDGTVSLLEVVPSPGSDVGYLCLQQAVLAAEKPGDYVFDAEPAVDCSLAVVQQPAQNAACADEVPMQTDQSSSTLLVSTGHGDVRAIIMHGAPGASSVPAGTSNVVYPLRPPPPLAGQYPVNIEAAYIAPNGELRCVMSAMHIKPKNAPCCEIYLAMLRLQQLTTTSSPQAPDALLEVVSVHLLCRSQMLPHVVLPNPHADAILLGVEPRRDDAAMEGVEHIDCTKLQGGAMQGRDDDEECDIDPRTLEQAAARLAKYTTEEAVGPSMHQPWADLYKESGPDNVGSMGSEPMCELMVVTAAAAAAAAAAGPQQQRWPQVAEETWHLAFGPNKLLSAETPGLLGVSDDVDCAVLRVGWPAGSSSTGEQQPAVLHAGYIPALAYVVAGKVQRKHLLLGEPGTTVSAVLVEGQKFYYTYGLVGQSQQYGQQEVVDMLLDADEMVQGARLLAGAAGKGQTLLVLTQKRLLVHSFKA